MSSSELGMTLQNKIEHFASGKTCRLDQMFRFDGVLSRARGDSRMLSLTPFLPKDLLQGCILTLQVAQQTFAWSSLRSLRASRNGETGSNINCAVLTSNNYFPCRTWNKSFIPSKDKDTMESSNAQWLGAKPSIRLWTASSVEVSPRFDPPWPEPFDETEAQRQRR